MNLKEIREIQENTKVLINGIEHLCTMASGYALSDNINFRFTNMKLPKKVRHSVKNEYYFPCSELKNEIDSKKLSFIVLGVNAGNIQYSLF